MKDVTSFNLIHGRPWKNYTYSYCIFIFEFRGGGWEEGNTPSLKSTKILGKTFDI